MSRGDARKASVATLNCDPCTGISVSGSETGARRSDRGHRSGEQLAGDMRTAAAGLLPGEPAGGPPPPWPPALA